MQKHKIAANMKVAAVTLSKLAKSERFAKVSAPPEGQSESMVQQVALPLPVAATAAPSALGDGPILAPLFEDPGDGQILAPLFEDPGDGQILAPLVQAAPSSSLVLPAGCFMVPSKNASMYGKNMRNIHMAGFSVESDAVIRFRSSDGKVAVADVLVGVGKFNRLDNAVRSITYFIGNNDDIVKDLNSMEIDKTLSEKVCI